MNTAIDLVIESLTILKDEAFVEAKSSRFKNEENPVADAIYTAYSIAIKEASKLKETEKKQIINAYTSGAWENYEVYKGEDYYKDNFENNT